MGSINLDLVASAERLPRPGETVTGATFARYPGGKGANQAVAAARLGADVRLVGALGEDPTAEEAIAGLRETDVDLDLQRSSEPTGVALITVDAEGETTIVVAPGANRKLEGRPVDGAVLCQLEIPDEPVLAAAGEASFFCLNAAPARPIDVEPDLLIVNRYEHEVNSRGRLVALTLGAEGAVLLEEGKRSRGPSLLTWKPSTERRRGTPSRPASSSRTSRAAGGTRRCAGPARQERSPPRDRARSRHCRRRRRSTRSCNTVLLAPKPCELQADRGL